MVEFLQKNKAKILFFLVVLFLITAVFLFMQMNKKDPYELTLYGNIEIRQVNLAFRVSGRLKKLYHEEGDFVKQGQILAELDSDTYQTALKKAKAQLADAQTAKKNTYDIYQRNIMLCRDKTVSEQECENILTNKEQAQAQYDLAVSEVERAQISLNDTKILAPTDGTILTRIQEKGAILSTNMPVYSLSLVRPIWVRAYIPETELGKIKYGQKALIYSDSRPDKAYTGYIGFISPVAEFTPKTVETLSLRTDLVYRLRIIIEDVDEYLRQGMPVTVKIKLEPKVVNEAQK